MAGRSTLRPRSDAGLRVWAASSRWGWASYPSCSRLAARRCTIVWRELSWCTRGLHRRSDRGPSCRDDSIAQGGSSSRTARSRLAPEEWVQRLDGEWPPVPPCHQLERPRELGCALEVLLAVGERGLPHHAG